MRMILSSSSANLSAAVAVAGGQERAEELDRLVRREAEGETALQARVAVALDQEVVGLEELAVQRQPGSNTNRPIVVS